MAEILSGDGSSEDEFKWQAKEFDTLGARKMMKMDSTVLALITREPREYNLSFVLFCYFSGSESP